MSAHELIRIQAAGGTGAWSFELSDNQSGGLVNEATGAYLAGETVDTIDRLRLSDSGCLGEAFIDIRIVRPLEVVPRSPEVERLGTLLFEPRGLGDYALELRPTEAAEPIGP